MAAKKASSRKKAAKKAAKTGRKTTTAARTRKKKTVKKTTAAVSACTTPVRARSVSPSRRTPSKKAPTVEPGPPTVTAPPVEEPAQLEEAIGIVTHYYSHLGVAVVQLNQGTLRTGDRIRIHGHSSDFSQVVGSMEYEHQHVDRADAGQLVGVKVVDHAREHDIVYLVK